MLFPLHHFGHCYLRERGEVWRGFEWRSEPGIKMSRSVVCCGFGALSCGPRKPPVGRWGDGQGLLPAGEGHCLSALRGSRGAAISMRTRRLQGQRLLPERGGWKQGARRDKFRATSTVPSPIPQPGDHLWLFPSSKAGFPDLQLKEVRALPQNRL